MSFMQQQIEHGQWLQVETDNGTEVIPADLVSVGLTVDEESADDGILGDVAVFCEGEPRSVKLVEGWGGRLSAPGYMDCTEWSLFESEADAEASLDEMYGEE